MSGFGNSILSVSSSSTVKLGAEQVNVNQEIARFVTQANENPNRIIFQDHFGEVPEASNEEADAASQKRSTSQFGVHRANSMTDG